MSLWWLSLVLIGAGVCLLVASPSFRRRFFRSVLFPLGYAVYNSRLVGYNLIHRRISMASAAAAPAHSKIDAVKSYGTGDAAVQVVPIPMLDDNYAYLLLHTQSKTAALVDPADATVVQAALKQFASEYRLTHILTTHKHWDHAGGNIELAKAFPDLEVVGGKGDGVAAATRECTTGDEVTMAENFVARVYQCPCHTRGHILYHVAGSLLFTGDTLFAAGCGKFFEGDARQMYSNLYETIGKLPESTYIMPGHEYTVSNLEYAVWVEPDNAAAQEKLLWSQERRSAKLPTIPTTLKEELSYNPFMRVEQPSVINRVSRVLNRSFADGSSVDDRVAVMDALRTLKNENAHKKK